MQEKLTKAKARAQILENVEFGEEQVLQGEILGIHQQSLHSKQTKKEDSEALHSQQDGDYLIPVYQAEHKKKEFSSEKSIVDALCHLAKQQWASDMELDAFDVIHWIFIILWHFSIKQWKKLTVQEKIGNTAQIHKWECERDDETLCTGTINYGLSICQEDTGGEIRKSIPSMS